MKNDKYNDENVMVPTGNTYHAKLDLLLTQLTLIEEERDSAFDLLQEITECVDTEELKETATRVREFIESTPLTDRP